MQDPGLMFEPIFLFDALLALVSVTASARLVGSHSAQLACFEAEPCFMTRCP